jgi:hypothetical protein
VEVGLVALQEDDLAATDPLVQALQLLDVSGPLFWVGLAQQLLDLLERQPGPFQGGADGVAPGAQAEGLPQPLSEFLDRPEMAGQAMVERLAVLDDVDDLFYLLLAKRGALPPVLR